MIDKFGDGLSQEKPVDDMDRNVLASGKTQLVLTSNDNGEASPRAVLPFNAKKEFRTTACLKCHGVDEGSVLGLASVTVDIKDDWANHNRVRNGIWISEGALQIVLFLVIGLVVRRLLVRPLSQTVDVARAVAAGDLSTEFNARGTDEIAQLQMALKDMQSSLVKVVIHVRQGSESVSTASAEIAQGNSDLSARTESQASALEETAASMEELSSTVR